MTTGSRKFIDQQTNTAAVTLPTRKTIRAWLAPMKKQRTTRAIWLLIVDLAVYGSLLAGTVAFEPWWAKLICGLGAGICIGRLFIIGHDACHQSFTPNAKLNKVLGRISMLPSLTPYSLWQVGHNVVHHGYTNLKGTDFVWAPLTREEYQAMSPSRRVLEHIYRSGWGPWLYYFIEMWWLRMFFPNKQYMATRRTEFLLDSIVSAVGGTAWIGGMIAAAVATGQPVWLILLFGFLVPFLVWNALIGFVVYVHHTHPKVQWHDDKKEWAATMPFVSTTVHLIFPFRFGGMFHHIMEHTAHHVDMSVPLYNLKEAQAILEENLPDQIIVQRFSWRWYFDTARRCKLYDFRQRCWTDFAGRTTNEATPAPA